MCIKYEATKRVVMAMSGIGPRSWSRSLFRKLNIFPTACQHILSLMLFIVGNHKDSLTNAYVHGLDTTDKNNLL